MYNWQEKFDKLIGMFSARVDLNTYGKEIDRENHPDILWLRDKFWCFISDLRKKDEEELIKTLMRDCEKFGEYKTAYILADLIKDYYEINKTQTKTNSNSYRKV